MLRTDGMDLFDFINLSLSIYPACLCSQFLVRTDAAPPFSSESSRFCFTITVGFGSGGVLALRPPSPRRQLLRVDTRGRGYTFDMATWYCRHPTTGSVFHIYGFTDPAASFSSPGSIASSFVKHIDPILPGIFHVSRQGERVLLLMTSRPGRLPEPLRSAPFHCLGYDTSTSLGNVLGNRVYHVSGAFPVLPASTPVRILQDSSIRFLDLTEIAALHGFTDKTTVAYLTEIPFHTAMTALTHALPVQTHSMLYESLASISDTHVDLRVNLEVLTHALGDDCSADPVVVNDFFTKAAVCLLDRHGPSLGDPFKQYALLFQERVLEDTFSNDLFSLLESLDSVIGSESSSESPVDEPVASEVKLPVLTPTKSTVHGDKTKKPRYVSNPLPLPQHVPGTVAHAEATLRANEWHQRHHASAEKMRQTEIAFPGEQGLKWGDHQYMEPCEACRSMHKHVSHSSYNEHWHAHDRAAPCEVLAFDASNPNVKSVYGNLRYPMHFIDIVSHAKWIFFCRNLSTEEILACFMEIINVV